MKLAIILALSLFISNLSTAQNAIIVGSKFNIDSKILNKKREIWVGLPSNYDSTKQYPSIYVLDAEWQFDIALSVTKELAAIGKIPEHIVVGIPKISGNHRFKDYQSSLDNYKKAPTLGNSDESVRRKIEELERLITKK